MNSMFTNRPGVHESAHPLPFVPALGHPALTPLYAALSGLTRRTLRRFLRRAGIGPGMTVLDLGCGTGTLVLLIKQAHPTARVVGLDVDPTVLEVARDALARARVDAEVRQGTVETAAFPPGSFDRVVTTFVLHHLTAEGKRSTLAASRRLLRPGGELHVADFGPPHTVLMRLASLSLHAMGGERVAANIAGEIPALVREAGFAQVSRVAVASSLLGTVTHWRATVPAHAASVDSMRPDDH
ncbi:MAG: class I SAM-dependent methyltransferase [Pseudonocardia sp.]